MTSDSHSHRPGSRIDGPDTHSATDPGSATDPVGANDLDGIELSRSSGLCGGPGQISCEEANEMIQMVIDHLSDDHGVRRLHDHLGDCNPCEHEYVVYQRIVASLVRSRPRMPEAAVVRITEYCETLCSGEHGDGRGDGARREHGDGARGAGPSSQSHPDNRR